MGLYDVNNNLSMWNFYGSIPNNNFNINYKNYVNIRNGLGFSATDKIGLSNRLSDQIVWSLTK